MLFVFLCPGTPKGSTGIGSGFKASQKTGQRLKISSDKLGEDGDRTCDPWFTRHRLKTLFLLNCVSPKYIFEFTKYTHRFSDFRYCNRLHAW